MKNISLRKIGFGVLAAVWILLTAAAWLLPARENSDAERRKLAQFPELSGKTLLNGSFMSKFESYTLDQFPLRDGFRTVKSLFHYNVLRQLDNNDIYLAEGYAAKLEYPLNDSSLQYAANKFNWIYDTCLTDTGSNIYLSIVPDKGYYLAEPNGYPALDYNAMFTQLQEAMPWAEYVHIADQLTVQDYYRTDTHWRQENLLPVAHALADAMGVTVPEFTPKVIDRPFYGVYYGQAALPMEPETLTVMENPILSQCTVINHEADTVSTVYDMTKYSSRDLYDIYLSGATSLLTIHNPAAASDRELIVFRDSFGSSLIPLLLADYSTVTVVDIRYMASNLLPETIDFHGQDVLFLYSTLILNSSNSLK